MRTSVIVAGILLVGILVFVAVAAVQIVKEHENAQANN